ncbi:leucine-rich repeat-containing protein 28-like [Rhodamnia argentea]|uniref:Leucine-rich repeat-containing protein 28-like n=1 Tax=Rhodamnia argentea TaxID=178133 RepID=A0A8B8N870_9MYRT|nr:leucine-rich repeat-containing protein 28-like [Rhodamnia argentea]
MCSSSIRSIPSAIGMLEKLEELDAENCQRLEGTIPDDIGRLLSLRILKLSDTRICYIPRLPESLLSLHIGTNSMTELPDLSNLINLRELNLEIPQVPEFCLGEEDSTFVDTTELIRHPSPWWIGRLCNLESLKLSCDNISVLHPDIGLLSELKRLELVCLNLQFLPRLPSSLLCLLIKSSRSLESSIDLSNLKELSELRIYSSAITGVHGLDGLENLQTLDLQALNALERLPDLSNLKKLNELHLGHCHNLVDIRSIQGLGHLRILELIEIVQLERVPDLSNLKKLTELHLRQCHNLTEIRSFEGLENLKMLELGELPLLEGLPDLSDLKKLTKLDVRQCHHLVKIQGRLDSLEDLCIYGCRSLVEMPAPSSFKNLKSLQLRDCEMLDMQQDWVPKSDPVDTEFRSSECLMMKRLGICVCQLGRHFFLPSLPS